MSTQATPTSSHESELQRRLEGMPKVSSMPILWFALAVVVVWTAGIIPWAWQYGAWPWELPFGIEKGKAAEFGDSFGFINSLISSLALVGVIAAIWLQKKELEEQRRVMILTQIEMEQSTEAHKESRNELAKQARINLQATVLAALDGIAKAAENPQLYPGDEGPAAVAFVNEMRCVVIFDILGDDGTKDNSPFLVEALDRWRKLSSQIAICNEIVFRATRLSQAAQSPSSSVHRPNPSDGDFPGDKRAEFETLLMEKGQQLSKLDAATVDDGVVARLNDLATRLQQGTKEKLDRVIETANWHANACRKSRTELFTTANQTK